MNELKTLLELDFKYLLIGFVLISYIIYLVFTKINNVVKKRYVYTKIQEN